MELFFMVYTVQKAQALWLNSIADGDQSVFP